MKFMVVLALAVLAVASVHSAALEEKKEEIAVEQPEEDENGAEIFRRCRRNTCQNGGSCRNTLRGYRCSCADGFSGDNCEIRDWCFDNPCRNGGTCENEGDDFSCTCPEGFRGSRCQRRIPDICRLNPCENGGRCDANGALPRDGFTCSCRIGFSGNRCQDHICDPRPCGDNGDCRARLFGGYRCRCNNDWTGDNCEIPPWFDCDINNPCTPENAEAGKFFFEAEDNSGFVQCSAHGQCFEMQCPAGLVWDQSITACDWP